MSQKISKKQSAPSSIRKHSQNGIKPNKDFLPSGLLT
jgi:hypothetical protein